MRNEERMRNGELGMRNGEVVEAGVVDSLSAAMVEPVGVGEAVPGAEYLVPGTDRPAAVEVPLVIAAETVAEPLAKPESVAIPASDHSAFPIPNSALPRPAKRVRPPAISKITGKRIEAPALKTPEFLRQHGLDPADYGGGRSDDPGPIWITGPDPRDVLLRDVAAMTDEEYAQHLRDVAFLKANGAYIDPDPTKTLVCHFRPGIY